MASASRALLLCRLSPLTAAASRCLRPISAAGSLLPAAVVRPPAAAARGFAAKPRQSSLRDYSSPNCSNRSPKETTTPLEDGCDFEHWLVVMEAPPGDEDIPDTPRDEIIDGYIKTLAQVVGSEDEARMKIYSVSTRHYFAFGALVSEELSYKIKELPKVRWVLPDAYLNVKDKDYGGEPFINGQAVPYDPKYHEEWVRNCDRANEPRRRKDKPCNFDKPRNFQMRRENTQAYQNGPAPPSYQSPPPPSPGKNQMPPRDAHPMCPAQGPPPSGVQQNYQPDAGAASTSGDSEQMGQGTTTTSGDREHTGQGPPENSADAHAGFEEIRSPIEGLQATAFAQLNELQTTVSTHLSQLESHLESIDRRLQAIEQQLGR